MLTLARKGCINFKLPKQRLWFSCDALVAQKLNERTLLRLSGEDAHVYMQGLMTNDMTHLQNKTSSIFSMFLNSKGRVLYDTIIYKTPDINAFLVECDEAAALPLKDHLMHFKVRKKINIDVVGDEFDIWVTSKGNHSQNLDDISDSKKIKIMVQKSLPNTISTLDPRLPNLGLRIIIQKHVNLLNEIEKAMNLKVKEENFYRLLRYKFGIGEGLQELPFEKCFPLEVNGDYMHGISFHKGCYIGQELTARTYHTGVVRKRIMPIIFDEKIESFEQGVSIYSSEDSKKSIGKLFGVEQNSGIGMLRIEEALKAPELIIAKNKCKTHCPFWWPKEAPKTRMNIG